MPPYNEGVDTRLSENRRKRHSWNGLIAPVVLGAWALCIPSGFAHAGPLDKKACQPETLQREESPFLPPPPGGIVAERPPEGKITIVPFKISETPTAVEWRWIIFTDREWHTVNPLLDQSKQGFRTSLGESEKVSEGKVGVIDIDIKVETTKSSDGTMDITATYRRSVGSANEANPYQHITAGGIEDGSFGPTHLKAAPVSSLFDNLFPEKKIVNRTGHLQLMRALFPTGMYSRVILSRITDPEPLAGSQHLIKDSDEPRPGNGRTAILKPPFTASEMDLVKSGKYVVDQIFGDDYRIYQLVKSPGRVKVIGSERWIQGGLDPLQTRLSAEERKLMGVGYQLEIVPTRFFSHVDVDLGW